MQARRQSPCSVGNHGLAEATANCLLSKCVAHPTAQTASAQSDFVDALGNPDKELLLESIHPATAAG